MVPGAPSPAHEGLPVSLVPIGSLGAGKQLEMPRHRLRRTLPNVEAHLGEAVMHRLEGDLLRGLVTHIRCADGARAAPLVALWCGLDARHAPRRLPGTTVGGVNLIGRFKKGRGRPWIGPCMALLNEQEVEMDKN